MKIEITATPTSRQYQDQTFYSQEAYIHKDGVKYPERVSISVENPAKSYPVGFYELRLDASTYIGQYDQLTFSRYLSLVPVKA